MPRAPVKPLQALAYFDGGDLDVLPASVKRHLARAVAEVGEILVIPRSTDRVEA